MLYLSMSLMKLKRTFLGKYFVLLLRIYLYYPFIEGPLTVMGDIFQ